MVLYLLPLAAYLLGSISSAIVISRAMGLTDPRTVGSKNPGATNVLRWGGKLAAALTLAGDILKGVAAVLAARLFTDDPLILASTAGAVFLGHLYPVWHGFRGGKGVATALGAWFALSPWVGVALIAIWLGMAVIFRYSSLAAIVASAAAPFFVWWLAPEPFYLAAMTIMSVLLLYRHRSNIRNLIAGRESRIGQKKTA
ncbi:MAG: glycerol-3-phosphate acyltransferase [Candidatus Muproteobacteria bacterium RBG_16_62_13]|uniref:Glycerol-3-phosphate acyltransferase n=1 Tax=Candidatus Muproteobacteria bacterium RBG_16_62_13 TaxID=1817756 RepID=A0A1F6T436_9PROT|nr:MAG: glycerol-3-phosphate acyltransferase [Candidatus Muproteobacteria bacterium RBG_16_62_13]